MRVNFNLPPADTAQQVPPQERRAGAADIPARVYDASCLSCYMTCPRLFYYKYVKKYGERVEPVARHLGYCMHQALNSWYQYHDVAAAAKEFAPLPPSTQTGGSLHTRERAQGIFELYVDHESKSYSPMQVLHQEVEFKLDMPMDRVFSGRMDMIVEWEGGIYVLDHKTTSKGATAYFFSQFRPNLQMDGYCYACRELMGTCLGVIINAISLAAKPQERFGRRVSTRTVRELDSFPGIFTEWAEKLEQDIEALSDPEATRFPFAPNTTRCSDWGGCFAKDVCIYGEDASTIERVFGSQDENEGVEDA